MQARQSIEEYFRFFGSKKANVIRHPVETIISSILVFQRCSSKFVCIDVIKCCDLYCVISTVREVSPREQTGATVLAEKSVHLRLGTTRRHPLVFRQEFWIGLQRKVLRLEDHMPDSHLHAHCAIALRSSLAQIYRCRVPDISAMATAMVSFASHDHHLLQIR